MSGAKTEWKIENGTIDYFLFTDKWKKKFGVNSLNLESISLDYGSFA